MPEMIVSIARIRYNTLSDGVNLCWRLILDGEEHLVNEVDVQTPCITTKDWLEDQQVYKHHITMRNCRVEIDEKGMARVFRV